MKVEFTLADLRRRKGEDKEEGAGRGKVLHVKIPHCRLHVHAAHSCTCTHTHTFIRLASLGGGPQAHVHMEGKKCRVLYLNLLGMNALFL